LPTSSPVSIPSTVNTRLQTHPHIRRPTNHPAVSLLISAYTAFSDLSSFITRQLPTSVLDPLNAHVPQAALVLSYSIGNMFLLLAGIALLYTVLTRDARVTRCYLLIVACGDLGHIYASYKVIESSVFCDFGNYNDMMFGNVVVSAFLQINRLATLMGVFGKVGGGTVLR
jgi:hypothetical protein